MNEIKQNEIKIKKNEIENEMEDEMEIKLNEMEARNEENVSEILYELENNLPPGWMVNEGSIEIENQMYSTSRNDQNINMERKQIENKGESINKIINEFTKMHQNLPSGWKLRVGSVVKDGEVYDIIIKDYEQDQEEEYCESRRRRKNEYRNYTRERPTGQGLEEEETVPRLS